MKNPTYREIAAACQVNVSTVSRALSNHRRIPNATRDRIRAVAEKLGWKPNPLALAYIKHVRSAREPSLQANLAFIVAFSNVGRHDDMPPYLKEVFSGAKQRATALGYSLEAVFFRSVGFNASKLSRILHNRGILGAIIHGGDLPESAFDAFDWESLSLVTHGFTIKRPYMHRVALHMGHAVRLILDQLRVRGYQRIALVLNDLQDELADYAILASYLSEQRRHRLRPFAHLFNSTRPHFKRKMREWLVRTKPDAIIGDHFVWEVMEDIGWTAPKDVGLASPFWGPDRPHLAGVDNRARVAGAHAIELLTTQIIQNERGIPSVPKLLLHEGMWQEGSSLKPIPRETTA